MGDAFQFLERILRTSTRQLGFDQSRYCFALLRRRFQGKCGEPYENEGIIFNLARNSVRLRRGRNRSAEQRTGEERPTQGRIRVGKSYRHVWCGIRDRTNRPVFRPSGDH